MNPLLMQSAFIAFVGFVFALIGLVSTDNAAWSAAGVLMLIAMVFGGIYWADKKFKM
jgi:hypothetical protein